MSIVGAGTRAAWLVTIWLALLAGCDHASNPVGPTPQPCQYTLSAASQAFGSDGGPGAVSVEAEGHCSWTVQGAGGWVTLTSPSNGTGTGVVAYAVAPNPDPAARTMTLRIGGQPLVIDQSGRASCVVTISPEDATFGAGGGNGTVEVTAPPGCGWAAASSQSWIAITAGTAGSGSGRVNYRVLENNSSTERLGVLTIADRTLTVRQAGEVIVEPTDCQYAVAPTEFLLHWHGTAEGEGSTIRVTTGGGCTWTASGGAGWLTIHSGRSGNGSGSIDFSATTYTSDGSRRAAVQVRWPTATAGQNAWVTQEGCRYALDPATLNAGAAGGRFQVTVLAGPISTSCPIGCPWTARSDASWLHLVSASQGAGDSVVAFDVDANAGAARTGTIRIAQMTLTVAQAGN